MASLVRTLLASFCPWAISSGAQFVSKSRGSISSSNQNMALENTRAWSFPNSTVRMIWPEWWPVLAESFMWYVLTTTCLRIIMFAPRDWTSLRTFVHMHIGHGHIIQYGCDKGDRLRYLVHWSYLAGCFRTKICQKSSVNFICNGCLGLKTWSGRYRHNREWVDLSLRSPMMLYNWSFHSMFSFYTAP